MRGGFVACLAASAPAAARLESAAENLRWHTGELSVHRHGDLHAACLRDDEHGPTIELRADRLLLAHGAAPQPLEALQRCDRFVGIESEGTSLRAIRDPMGEVPLFYRRLGDEFWLASEIHPLVALGRAEPDLAWLAAYSAMAELPDRTAWSGVMRVLPGEILEVDGRMVATSQRYFLPTSKAGLRSASAAVAAQRVRALLSAAVEARMSERCGVLLSGGLDSSAVAIVAAQAGRPMLLTISHPQLPDVDETRFAQAVADAAGIPLTTLAVEPKAWDPVDDIDTFGSPPLAAPTGMYAQGFRALAANGCDVALDGHDGDGTLGNSYAWCGNTLLDGRLDRLTREARKYGARVMLGEALKDLLPPSARTKLLRRRGVHAGQSSFLPYFRGATGARLADRVRWRPPRRGWKEAQLKALLPPTTQHFEETELVAARFGIDIRHPFADRRLIEFLITLPHAVKSSTTRNKPLLRNAFADVLPEIVVERGDKTHFAPVLDARVDFDLCYRWVRDSGARLPDIDYGRLFRDAARPVNDRMLWTRLASAHVFLANGRP